MSTTGLAISDETIARPTAGSRKFGQALDCDRHRSYQALRAVLHCLRDRLIIDEAAQLADQLPMLFRGIYYEALRPSGNPEKNAREKSSSPGLGQISRTRRSSPRRPRAVFQVLEKPIAPAAVLHVTAELPQEVRALA